jgi:cytochrome c553
MRRRTFVSLRIALLLLACIALHLATSVRAQESQKPRPIPASSPVDAEHAAEMKEGLALFKQDVRRILVGRCVKCHGGEKTEAELDLTSREGLLRGGANGPAVVLGDPAGSHLLSLVRHEQEPVMPEGGAKLDARQIEALARWIDLGAPYDGTLGERETDPTAWTRKTLSDSDRDFWSLQPLRVTAPPALNDPWIRNDIDRFVLQGLRNQGLEPQGPAEPHTLLRRLQLDLTGLPPTAEEADAFARQPDDAAWTAWIERLLDSPHFGERWARHWLDVARFAESHGFEQDYDRPHAYHYRDFVIKAFQGDMPYDQFVQWQLAGDEIAPHEPLALMATGFLGAGVFPTQLTEREFEPSRYDELDDRVATVGTAMLGLTVGCARCHDHKYDPIPSSDYYRLVATFATSIRSEIPVNLDPAGHESRLREFEETLRAKVAAREAYERDSLESAWQRWLSEASARTDRPMPATWQVLDLPRTHSDGGATFTRQADGSWLVSGESVEHDRFELTAELATEAGEPAITAVRLEALADPSLPQQGPGRAGNGNFALSQFTLRTATGDAAPETAEGWLPVGFAAARATHQQNADSLSVQASVDADPVSGWAVDAGGIGKDQTAVFDLAESLPGSGRRWLRFEMKFNNNGQHSLGRFRLSVTRAPLPVALEGDGSQQSLVEGMAVLDAGRPASDLGDAQRTALRAWFFARDPQWVALQTAIQQHEGQRPQPETTTVMVVSEGVKPIPHNADDRGFKAFYPETYFLRRGDVLQRQGVATTGYLQALTRVDAQENPWQIEPPPDSRLSYRRQALAAWITDADRGAGHLLARVIVNRVWQHHFGRGLVATPNDFGFQGERPTHPELLDWLAHDLITNGWRLKRLHRMILESATYRQTSHADPARAAIDPDNRLLWRFTPYRLEAEAIRDAMLAVTGRLDTRLYGPGSLDEAMTRRSIYFTIKRSRLIPTMQIFDAPEPLVSVGNRPATTIAPQALLFMNNPQVRDHARHLGRLLVAETGVQATDERTEAQVRAAYRRVLGRVPTDRELAEGTAFLASQRASYLQDARATDANASPLPASELALADLIQVLLSLNEFVFVE